MEKEDPCVFNHNSFNSSELSHTLESDTIELTKPDEEIISLQDEPIYITDLNLDLLIYISLFLDVYSFQKAAFVNKLASLTLQKDIFWKARFIHKFAPSKYQARSNSNFKKAYFELPRVRFDGAYVSRISYTKCRKIIPILDVDQTRGKTLPSPIIQIIYFRYLLFVPYGNFVLILRSDAEPSKAIQVLKLVEQKLHEKYFNCETCEGIPSNYTGRTENFLNGSCVVIGEYSFDQKSQEITIIYEEPCSTSISYINSVKLQLEKRPRFNPSLSWKELCIHPVDDRSDFSMTMVNLESAHYEPYHFKRIISYDHLA